MSFEGSRATIIKDLSGNIVSVTSGRFAVINSGSTTVVTSGQVQVMSGQIAIVGVVGGTQAFVQNDADLLGTAGAMQVMAVNYAVDPSVSTRRDRIRHSYSGSAISEGGSNFRLLVDTTQAGSNIKTGAFVPATALSGGIALAASGIVVHGIRIKVISGVIAGGNIHIGSSGNPPWVSGGYQLGYGETVELKAHNPQFVRVWGSTSGIPISWAGVDF